MSGKHAALQVPGVFPYCVLMQVAAEDTERDYVLCRGFDPRMNRFIDYEEDNENKPGIPVAKPYGHRMKGLYRIAEMYAAALPTQGVGPNICPSPTTAPIRLGQNPGKAQESPDQPTSLAEEVDELYTTEGKAVNWIFLQAPASELFWCMLMEDHPGPGVCFDILIGTWCWEEYKFRFDCDAPASDYEVGIDRHYTESAGGMIPEPAKYAQGWFKRMPAKWTDSGCVYVVVSLDCDSDGLCTPDHDLPCETGTDPCEEE